MYTFLITHSLHNSITEIVAYIRVKSPLWPQPSEHLPLSSTARRLDVHAACIQILLRQLHRSRSLKGTYLFIRWELNIQN